MTVGRAGGGGGMVIISYGFQGNVEIQCSEELWTRWPLYVEEKGEPNFGEIYHLLIRPLNVMKTFQETRPSKQCGFCNYLLD